MTLYKKILNPLSIYFLMRNVVGTTTKTWVASYDILDFISTFLKMLIKEHFSFKVHSYYSQC